MYIDLANINLPRILSCLVSPPHLLPHILVPSPTWLRSTPPPISRGLTSSRPSSRSLLTLRSSTRRALSTASLLTLLSLCFPARSSKKPTRKYSSSPMLRLPSPRGEQASASHRRQACPYHHAWYLLLPVARQADSLFRFHYGHQDRPQAQGSEYSWLFTCLYLAILCTEGLQNYLVQRLPINRWLGFCVFGWGLTCCFVALCHNFTGILVLRILLGCFECVCQPLSSLSPPFGTGRKSRLGLSHSGTAATVFRPCSVDCSALLSTTFSMPHLLRGVSCSSSSVF